MTPIAGGEHRLTPGIAKTDTPMDRLSNLSLRIKMFVAPTLLLIALIGIAVYTWVLLAESQRHVTELDEGAFKRVEMIGSLGSDVTGVHAGLYHLTSVAANDTNKEKVKALSDTLQKRIGATSAAMKTVAIVGGFDDATKATVAKLDKLYQTYVAAADQVANMVQFDTATASLFMVQAQDAFDLFTAEGDKLTAAVKNHAATQVAAIDEQANQARIVFVIAVALAATIAVGVTYWVSGVISRPIIDMAAIMRRLAGNQLDAEVPHLARSDEIGAMAAAVQVFKENLLKTSQLQAQQREAEERAAEEARKGDEARRAAEESVRAAETRAAEERRKEMLDLADSFEAQVGKVVADVSGTADQLQSTAGTMSTSAQQTSQQATAVAAAAEQASANVQTVASAAEELSQSIQEIARQVAQSNTIARGAVDEAKKTNAKVQGLAEAAQKIGEVVNLINDIASQTNLLALNATIEAARAGEAGKGFAVVASEVKSLANQTAKATEDISAQIEAIQGSTEEAVTAIQGIGTTIAEISEIATAIASAVEEQGAATREIAGNVQQAAAGTREVTGNIGGVTEAASDTGRATGQVVAAASELARHGKTLREEVDNFLKTVRAA